MTILPSIRHINNALYGAERTAVLQVKDNRVGELYNGNY